MARTKLRLTGFDLRGKRLFLRVDLNVPLAGDTISDDARIRAVLPTLEHCLTSGASVVLASHLGRPKGTRDPRWSLKPVAFRLEELLGRGIPLAPDCVGPVCETLARSLQPGGILLLENLRFHREEEANDPGFARALASLADCYVNDAFSVSHRAHSSVVAITRFLQPAVAGLLMQRELAALARVTERPQRPVVIILGGAKVSEKLGMIRQLMKTADRILIGGAMAFTFLKALGYETGFSLVDLKLVSTAKEILAEAAARQVEIILPEDVVVAAYPDDRAYLSTQPTRTIPCATMGLDIGPATVARFREALRDAGTVLWNGPMGMCERPSFATGTIELARAVAESPALTLAGGGDTIAAVERAGVAAKFGHLSMGGGAFLEYEVLVHLLRTRPWRFALAHLPEIAVAQHRLWSEGPGALRALHAVVDRTMARLAEAAGPDTTVFVFSECGAGPLRHGVCLNAWLAREGYLHRRGGAVPRVGRSLARARDRTYRFMPWTFGLSRLARRARAAISESVIDWSRTRAFCPGETAEIMLTVPAHERGALAGDLRARLLALRDPEGRRVVEDVIPRDAWGASWEFTPDLTVVWDEDAYLPMMTFDDSDEVFADGPPRPSGWPLTGAHRREGMVLASGPGIAPTDLGRVRPVDLVPTWLDLLGVAVPKAIEGTSFAPRLFGRP